MTAERRHLDTQPVRCAVQVDARGAPRHTHSSGRARDALRHFLEHDGHHVTSDDKVRCPSPAHEDRNPSAHVFDGDEGGHLHCFACEYHVDAFTYLVEHRGLTARQAVEQLDPSGPRPAPRPAQRRRTAVERVHECSAIPLPASVVEAHQRRSERLDRVPAALDGRGFTLDDLRRVNVAAEDDRAILPITSPTGDVLRLKVRRGPSERGARYYYLDTQGEGTPAWCSPHWGTDRTVLVVEGELNALAAWCARPGLDVVGVAGTSGSLPLTTLAGRTVVLYADGDDVGRRALDRWARALHARRCRVSVLEPWSDGDACDVAHKLGRDELRRRLA